MENTTEFWTKHVAAIRQEGVAVTVYAKRHDLSLASLYYWRQKIQSAFRNFMPARLGVTRLRFMDRLRFIRFFSLAVVFDLDL